MRGERVGRMRMEGRKITWKGGGEREVRAGEWKG
jgi:hypothetical protein